MSKKFIMDIVDGIITIETSLPEEECNIVNTELAKEVNYWKTCAMKNSEDVEEFKSKAPKRCMLIARKTKPTKKIEDIDSLIELLKSSFDLSLPNINAYIPNTPKTKNIKRVKEIEQKLKDIASYVNNIENFSLKNGYLFGRWLCLAFELYKREKYVFKNVELPQTFEKWIVRDFNISKTRSCLYRKLVGLIDTAPKLVHCRVSISFLMGKYNTLHTHFKTIDSVWSHTDTCDCEQCKKYFGTFN